MKSFEEAKVFIVDKATELRACKPELDKAKSSTNFDELIVIVRNNAGWCREKNFMTDIESIDLFGVSLSNLFNRGNSNSGDNNRGNSNSGDNNRGNNNSGYNNSGYNNSGDNNRGDNNSGDNNRGNNNSGYSNSGYNNSGDNNSGNCNSGYRNSGDCNSGYRNSGDCNSGYRNSGAFSSNENPRMILFDKLCDTMTVREWEQSKAYRLMLNISPTIWVPSSIMTDKEKVGHPKHETTEGYLKTISLKEAWANMWGNLSGSDKKIFMDLEHFDAEKFESITGIKI